MIETMIRRNPSRILRPYDAFVVERSSGGFLELTGTAWAIWDRLEYATTVDELLDSLAVEYAIEPEECRDDVAGFLDVLEECGLLETGLTAARQNRVRERYLWLTKRAITNLLYPEDALRINLLKDQKKSLAGDLRIALRDVRYTHAQGYEDLVALKRSGAAQGMNLAPYAFTMAGLHRLENIERLAEKIFAEKIPGDFLEAGVWRGGCAMMMRALQLAWGEADRGVWLADSFEGLPERSAEPDLERGVDLAAARYPQIAINEQTVLDNFRTMNLLDGKVRTIRGFFADSLPGCETGPLAMLRIDADYYSSTMEVLEPLYDRVSVGGYVIVDDYNELQACREAVDEFRASRGITDPIQAVDHTCIYWRKSR